MKIALYFGSFNPPHLGHEAIIRHIITNYDFDKVLVIVSPENPLKQIKSHVSETIRFEMAKLAFDYIPKVEISDIEFNLPKPSYTINTINILKEIYSKSDFTIILGEDNVENFKKWKDYEKILGEHKVLFYPRINSNYKSFLPNINKMKAPLFNISSTEIRKKLWIDKTFERFLNSGVFQFIIKNKIYIK